LIATVSPILVMSFHVLCAQVVAMSAGDDQGRERDVRERIARVMQSIGNGPGKQRTAEEAEKLKNAASRLDQILKSAADADQQALKDAAARLDRLLADIQAGKDVSSELKRRGGGGK
jgi:hypothetical protein